MVATLLRLKLALLKNGLKRSVWQIIGFIFGALYALFILAMLLAALFALRRGDVELKQLILVLSGSLLVLGWWVLPLLLSGIDQTLDPARFTYLPLNTTKLLTGLAIAGFIGIPGVLTVVLVIASAFVWLPNFLAVLGGLLAGILALGMIQLGARTLTTFFSGVLGGRRGREAVTVVVLLAAVLLGPTFALIMSRLEDVSSGGWAAIMAILLSAVDIAGWLPFGLPWQIPVDIANGAYLFAVLRLVYLGAFVVLLGWAWAKLFAKAAISPPAQERAAVAKDSRFARLERGPVSTIALRTLRYWRRDSRLAISNVTVLILPIAAFTLYLLNFGINVPAGLVIGAGPIVAGLYGWGLHNMLAYDGSAFWMHLITGVRGKDDRLGRLIAEGGTGLIIVVVITVAGIAITGRWDLLALAMVTALAILCITTAISTFFSTLWIYKVPAAGENPFSSSSGAGVFAVVSQLVTIGVAGVLSAPSLVAFIWAVLGQPPAWVLWTGVIAGVIVGPGSLWLGVHLGAKRLDERGPEVLTALREFS